MYFIKTVSKKLFNLIPNSDFLYKVSHRYVDRINSDNNIDASTNGEELLLFNELPKLRGGVVFDVGANVGNWARYAIKVEPTIQLHCFEPSRATFVKLAENKFSSNVFLNNFGLGEFAGKVELNIVDATSGMNSIYLRSGVESAKAIDKETIMISTIDDYCEEHGIDRINFLKVDVEGHELPVFKGMARMLMEKKVDQIQFEYGGCNLDARVYLLDIWMYLAPLGFKFYKIFPHQQRLYPNYEQQFETFKYSNWLARLER